jgi:methylase of polypeptide subunit release factors
MLWCTVTARVLDVGCGCGFIAACAAMLAGKQGSVVGVDIKPAAISLTTGNLDRLRESSSR